jgi:NitT/TauT family transport system substrate-binding protein
VAFYIAEKRGYFKAEGLKADFAYFDSGAKMIVPLGTGALDTGGGATSAGFYNAVDRGIELRIVADKGMSVDGYDYKALVVRKDLIDGGAFKSLADLKGKKVAIVAQGAADESVLHQALLKGGLNDGDIEKVYIPFSQQLVALQNKGIDAGMTTDPTAAQLLSTGTGKVLLDMRTEAGARAALGGLYPASSLYMDCAWVQAHPEQVQKLANAFVKTLRWIKGHSAEEIAAKMPAEYAAGDPQLYAKAVHDSIGMFNGDGLMKPDGAKNVLDVLGQFSPNVKGKKDQVDLAKTYTTVFAAKVAG